MHVISYPGQVCLEKPGWYESCVAFVQQASHKALFQPLRSARVWLWFRERDMIDSPDGALQLLSYSVQCGSGSPCRCCQLSACIHVYQIIKKLMHHTFALSDKKDLHVCYKYTHEHECLHCLNLYTDRCNMLLNRSAAFFIFFKGIKIVLAFLLDVNLLGTQNKWNL